MSEKEKKSREMLEQLAKLPPKTQERIGYIIEGALVLAESRDEEPAAKPGPENEPSQSPRGRQLPREGELWRTEGGEEDGK